MSEGFRGRAQVDVGGTVIVVDVQLADWFDPISGRHRWRGRLRDLAAALAPSDPPATGTELALTLLGPDPLLDPDRSATTTARVTGVDLWGSHMVDGLSAPPYRIDLTDLDPRGELFDTDTRREHH